MAESTGGIKVSVIEKINHAQTEEEVLRILDEEGIHYTTSFQDFEGIIVHFLYDNHVYVVQTPIYKNYLKFICLCDYWTIKDGNVGEALRRKNENIYDLTKEINRMKEEVVKVHEQIRYLEFWQNKLDENTNES